MAVTLEYSTNRGSSWTALTEYTHPTTTGVHHKHVSIGGIIPTTATSVRFRLTGTDAANWGLFNWKVKTPVIVEKERDLV